MESLEERARWLAKHVLRHEPSLRAWLRKRNLAEDHIDDIVQETYARLSCVSNVDKINNIRNYMFQAAHSIIVTQLRRSRIVEIHSFARLDMHDIAAEEPDPEVRAIDRDELQRLAKAIAQLPGKVRDVFVLRRVDGLSQREVAHRLGLSESTVEKHMSKGFRHLSALFARGGKPSAEASRTRPSKAISGNAKGDSQAN